ncbi:MAG TPA: helix-turn-helix transcriptional regulator [Terracidiphilus sp.]|jgi:hypothetical protein|nr:helix-turn-helix transcriptional regulator [Terracidiphilus sp.]
MSSVAKSVAVKPTIVESHDGVLVPKLVRSHQEAIRAAVSEERHTVWIVSEPAIANSVAHRIASHRPYKKAGYLFLISNARPSLIPAFEKRFSAVAFPTTVLKKEELAEIWNLPDRRDRFIGGTVDEGSKTITLWRGNFESITVPFDAFHPTANGVRPDFKRFSVLDYGQTLKFGEYESDTEPVFYEYAADFRKRLKQKRIAEEKTLGASIRRLRRQRRMTRDDFGDIDGKTIARIEHGQTKTPQAATLEAIARALGVRRDELGEY